MAAPSHRHGRMFTDAYDYSRLRDNIGWNDLSGTRQYIARARFDAIISREVVMTDSQFLHSLLLFNLAGSRFTSLSDLPLERIRIMTRAPTLDETLIRFLIGSDPDKETLEYYWFPAIDATGELAKAVAEMPKSEIGAWRDIPKVLRRASADAARVEQMEEAWAKTIEASNTRHGLRTEPWDTSFNFVGHFQKRIDVSWSTITSAVRTKAGQEALKAIHPFRYKRGIVVSTLTRLREHVTETADLADLSAIEEWFNGCYNATLADQHACDDTEIIDSKYCIPFDDVRRLFDQITMATGKLYDLPDPTNNVPKIKLPNSFLAALAKMEPKDYEILLTSNEARAELENWHNNGDWSAFRRALDHIVEHIDKQHTLDADLSRVQRIFGRLKLIFSRDFPKSLALTGSAPVGGAITSGAIASGGALMFDAPLPVTAAVGSVAGAISAAALKFVLPKDPTDPQKIYSRSMVKQDILNVARRRTTAD